MTPAIRIHTAGAAIVLGLAATSASAVESLDTLRSAVSGGKPSLDARLRFENVDQANRLRTADAFTARARLGYTTGKWNGFDVMGEYESVTAFGGAEYNSTVNGRSRYSVIADPYGSELNQSWIRYTDLRFKTTAKYGRQKLIFDNARFLGNAGWRQNETTFDAASISTTWLPKTTLDYAFISNVNSFNSTNIPMWGNVVHLSSTPYSFANVTAYGYWFDYKTNTKARPDTRSLGLRATGTVPVQDIKLSYALEYAYQSQYGQAPTTIGSNYFLAEVASTFARIWTLKAPSVKLGYEVLGGNGQYGFQTPLATLFAFQGWADQFLTTPANGVADAYVQVGATLEKVQLQATWHDFRAVQLAAHYGSEWNLHISRPLVEGVTVGLRYADYDSKGFSSDTRKAWAWLEYKF